MLGKSTGLFGSSTLPAQPSGLSLFGQPQNTATPFPTTSSLGIGNSGNNSSVGGFGLATATPMTFGTSHSTSFAAPLSGHSGIGSFGATSGIQQPSLFRSGLQGTLFGHPTTSIFQTPSGSQQLPQLAPEVQQAVSKLSNADPRTVLFLQETFQRLSHLIVDHHEFLTFTFRNGATPQMCKQKNAEVEQQCIAKGPQFVEKLRAAQLKNPDSERFYVEAIAGFENLSTQTDNQFAQIETLSNSLHELHERQRSLRDTLTYKTATKVQKINDRHRKLQAKYLSVLGTLEEYALQHQMASIDRQFMQKLNSDLESLETKVETECSSSKLFQIRENIHALRDCMKPSARCGGTGSAPVENHSTMISEEDAQNLFEVIDQLQNFYDELKKAMADDLDKLNKIHDALVDAH